MIKSLQDIDIEDIKKFFNELGITKNVDIAELIGVGQSSVAQVIKGDRELTKWHKSAFYHYIKCYELNKQIEQLKKQLQGDNQTEQQKQINELSKQMHELKIRFEQLQTSLNKKEDRR